MSSQDPVPGTPSEDSRSSQARPPHTDDGTASPHQAPSFGQAPGGGQQPQAPYGGAPHGQAPSSQAPGAQPSSEQNPYGQNPYGQAPQGQNPYGQNPYGQTPQGQNPYGQPGYPQGPGSQQQGPGAQQEYSAQGNYGPATFRPGAKPLNPSDARTWAVVAHLAAPVLNLLSAGWLGVAAPLVLWLVFKDRDPLVRNAAAGAFNFNLAAWIASIISWVLIFTVIGAVIGIPLLIIVWVLTAVYAIMGAMKASRGEAYRYGVQLPVLT